jgi:hypothetical protein
VVTLYRENDKWDSKLYKLKIKKIVNNACVTVARATIDLSKLAQLNQKSVLSDMQLLMKGTNPGNLHIVVKCTWSKQMDQRKLQRTRSEVSEVSDTDFEMTQSMKDVDVLVPVIVEEEEPVELVKLKAAADERAKAGWNAAEKAKVEAEGKANSGQAKAEAAEAEAKAKTTKVEAARAEAEVKAMAEAKPQANKDTMAKIYTDLEAARKKAKADDALQAKLDAEAKARAEAEELARSKAQGSVKSRAAVFGKNKKPAFVAAVAFIFAAVAAAKIGNKARPAGRGT